MAAIFSPSEWATRGSLALAFAAMQLPVSLASTALLRPSPAPLHVAAGGVDPWGIFASPGSRERWAARARPSPLSPGLHPLALGLPPGPPALRRRDIARRSPPRRPRRRARRLRRRVVRAPRARRRIRRTRGSGLDRRSNRVEAGAIRRRARRRRIRTPRRRENPRRELPRTRATTRVARQTRRRAGFRTRRRRRGVRRSARVSRRRRGVGSRNTRVSRNSERHGASVRIPHRGTHSTRGSIRARGRVRGGVLVRGVRVRRRVRRRSVPFSAAVARRRRGVGVGAASRVARRRGPALGATRGVRRFLPRGGTRRGRSSSSALRGSGGRGVRARDGGGAAPILATTAAMRAALDAVEKADRGIAAGRRFVAGSNPVGGGVRLRGAAAGGGGGRRGGGAAVGVGVERRDAERVGQPRTRAPAPAGETAAAAAGT